MAYTQNKEFKTRIACKHDIAANWSRATNFIPLAGEIIVYDCDLNADQTYPRIKIGDGRNYINDLPFYDGMVGYAGGNHSESELLTPMNVALCLMEGKNCTLIVDHLNIGLAVANHFTLSAATSAVTSASMIHLSGVEDTLGYPDGYYTTIIVGNLATGTWSFDMQMLIDGLTMNMVIEEFGGIVEGLTARIAELEKLVGYLDIEYNSNSKTVTFNKSNS